MDLQTYQKAKIQSFFNIGLKFSVDGDQLAVTGFKNIPPGHREPIQERIKRNKKEIMTEVLKNEIGLDSHLGDAGEKRSRKCQKQP